MMLLHLRLRNQHDAISMYVMLVPAQQEPAATVQRTWQRTVHGSRP
jgi:hypothetical protein